MLIYKDQIINIERFPNGELKIRNNSSPLFDNIFCKSKTANIVWKPVDDSDIFFFLLYCSHFDLSEKDYL